MTRERENLARGLQREKPAFFASEGSATATAPVTIAGVRPGPLSFPRT